MKSSQSFSKKRSLPEHKHPEQMSQDQENPLMVMATNSSSSTFIPNNTKLISQLDDLHKVIGQVSISLMHVVVSLFFNNNLQLMFTRWYNVTKASNMSFIDFFSIM
jgi:hypothetical protein